MSALLHSLAMFVIDFFKSPRRLEAANLFLRHQLSIALRRAPPAAISAIVACVPFSSISRKERPGDDLDHGLFDVPSLGAQDWRVRPPLCG